MSLAVEEALGAFKEYTFEEVESDFGVFMQASGIQH